VTQAQALIANIPRIHKATVAKFAEAGFLTFEDLLWHFPFRYDDFSETVQINDVTPETTVTIRGTVKSIVNRTTKNRRMRMTEAILSDDSGSISVLWFNQPYLTHVVKQGDTLLCSGKAHYRFGKLSMASPAWEKEKEDQAHVGRIVPVYATKKDLTVKTIRTFIQKVLPAADMLPEVLPENIMAKQHFPSRGEAVRAIHFPESMEALKKAKARFTYEELFFIQLAVVKAKKLLKTLPAHAIAHDDDAIKTFLQQFSFDLTNDQRKAAWKILQDMEQPRPMNRLLQGDVGSGKTLVAEIVLFSSAKAGFQGALLAPTEILARQHAERFTEHVKEHGLSLGLVTGGTARLNGREVPRTELEQAVRDGNVNILVGTHALLNERMRFKKLGLIVIDEQHRFGVEQRKILREQAMERHGSVPHFLSMTATPIPRSLALTIYGDLDLTLIKELPTGEKRITTKALPGEEREHAFTKMKEMVSRGKQCFVVYPIIDPSDTLGVRAATEEFKTLADIFPEKELSLLHGRMKPDEKQNVLDRFARGENHILVTTSVIEVGIDVPDASFMLIEGAERFGLAQLHQLRGRIGRAGQEAFCYLATDQKNRGALERLRLMEHTLDGFTLAEKDLELRGPGEIFGKNQSGYSGETLAHLTNSDLIAAAQQDADALLKQDPELEQYPALKAVLQQRTIQTHFE
jgi:ATP-dependent DNA helicase RecG